MTRIQPATTARNLAGLAGALALAWSSFGLAQHHRGPQFPISIADARAEVNARFDALDADGDGLVSRAEFMNAPVMGRGPGMHTDGKGPAIMMIERHKGPRAEEAQNAWAAKREAMEAEVFKRLDKDGDGKISEEEFDGQAMAEARREIMLERMFDRLDGDGNGTLTREDMGAWVDQLAAMDADDDGTVTREEARAHRQARRNADG
jgi:Ca2+-binding EF-hand superfamily protein